MGWGNSIVSQINLGHNVHRKVRGILAPLCFHLALTPAMDPSLASAFGHMFEAICTW